MSHDIWELGYKAYSKWPDLEQGWKWIANFQVSTTISAPILLIEPKDHDQSIHMDPANRLIMIFRLWI